MEKPINHTFVVLAYKESPYLNDCIESLINQSCSSRIIITTSTPNKHIENIAKQHDVDVIVNTSGGSIAKDWNFALKSAHTELVTLIHQDDIYFKDYLLKVHKLFAINPDALICFTNYAEIKKNKISSNSVLILIKRILIFVLGLGKHVFDSRREKLRIQKLGNIIPCPSVTYNILNCKDFNFDNSYSVNLDWKAWLDLAFKDGAFLYANKVLMAHRIHDLSETSNCLSKNIRQAEDFYIIQKLWGKLLGSIIYKLYTLSYLFNKT